MFLRAIFIYSKQKVIFSLFHDFWDRFLPAIRRGEKPEKVSFETLEKH